MSRHVTYRGTTIDMDTLRRENEKTVAIGNMKVNARGDQLSNGVITKTADQLARENHRTQSAVISAGLKGPMPAAPASVLDTPGTVKKPVANKRTVEKELPSGDIVIEDDAA